MSQSLTHRAFLSLQPCEIWCLLRRQTSFHSNVVDCLRCALEHPDAVCGLYACDGECYDRFRCLFWPVIMDSHRVDLRTLTFQHDFGDVQHLPELTSSMLDRILSIRIRLNRSIQGYPMIAKLTEEQLGEIEDRFRSEAIEHFDNDLQGNYQSLKDIPEGDGQRENFFSRKPINRQRESAGVYRHWPTGRGVYLNREENFYVWVNEEDHLSLISQSRHSQIRDTYGRLQRAMEKVNQVFDFQQHPRLGYLNFSPLNIGTALQIDIQLRFAHPEKVDAAMEFCRKRDIRLAATNEKNVVDLSNVIRLGRTEFHLVRGMIDTVERLLEISEKEKQEH